MIPTVMTTETFSLLVCDEITRAIMLRLQAVERENGRLRQQIVTGEIRPIARNVRAIRRLVEAQRREGAA